MALKSSYVAIGGMGCDAVCQQVSSLAVSMRLPFVSYECTSPQFSDKVAYPALARLGSVTRTAALSTIGDMRLGCITSYWRIPYVYLLNCLHPPKGPLLVVAGSCVSPPLHPVAFVNDPIGSYRLISSSCRLEHACAQEDVQWLEGDLGGVRRSGVLPDDFGCSTVPAV